MTINKYGLSRNVPAEVKRIIRKKDGYGCIFCGKIFIQYEHIDPQWSDAKEHDASKMALLCNSCHADVTHKRIAKIRVTKAKEDPFCKKNGFANGKFFPHPENMKIKIGNSIFANTDIAITLFGKPLIWVTQDIHDKSCPLQYCGVFFDSSGNKIAYLNKNMFIALIEGSDFQAIENRIEVRSREREINLTLKIEGDEYLEIDRINSSINQNTIKLSADKKIVFNDYILPEIYTDYCQGGLALSSIPISINKKNNIHIEIHLSFGNFIKNISGNTVGFLLNQDVIDLNRNKVGYIINNKVFNIINEYIGELNKTDSWINIVMYSDEYEDQEPIWVSHKNKKMQMFLNKPLYDMSYRLFGFDRFN